MSIVAPKGRKHLPAVALFRLMQSGFDNIPDHRLTDAEISLTDALMSAFAMFSLNRPPYSPLRKNAPRTIWKPSMALNACPATRMREILDPVFPEALRPVFKRVFTQVQRGKH